MRIRIKPTDRTSLPLIPELPDWSLARMEGYNGIGKSLTIRLLQLCTGGQPYRATRPWEGLRDGLGQCEIRIDALADGREVRWRLDSRLWPKDPQPVDDNWDGLEVEIDGHRASLAEVASIVSVHRLAGDVGLAETLGEQIEADRVAFAAWAKPLVDPDGSPLRAVEDRMAAAAEIIDHVDVDATARVRHARAEADGALEASRSALAKETARQTALADALQLRDQLTEARGAGQAADDRIAAIDVTLQRLAAERDALVADIATLEGDAARSDEAAQALKKARRRLELHRGHLNTEFETLARLADLIGVNQQDLATVDERQLAEWGTQAQDELDTLLERRAAIDAAPMMSDLLDDLVAALERGEEQGLGRQPLLDPTEGVALTVGDLRQRLADRRNAIHTDAPSEQGAALAERVDHVVERLRSLDGLPRVRREIARRQRLASEADDAIRELVARADTTAAHRLEELVRRRREIDAELHALTYERTALHKRRRPADVETLQERLEAAMQEAGTSDDALPDELQAQAAAAREAQLAFREAEELANSAAEEAAAHQATLQRVVRAINDDEALAWLRRAQPVLVPQVEDDADRQLDALSRLARVVSRAEDRVGRARTQVDAIDGALQRLYARLAGRPEEGGEVYLEEVTTGYGAEFARWFDETLVRTELFPGAVRVRDVDLHANRLEVVWETDSDGDRARPLEAFSRGEQAFAYTRARLASLDSSSPRARNRLIVLDEFGAFIAHNRLSRLIAMLAQRRDGNPEDQHLLVLPLAADYDEAARSAPVDQRDALQTKARSLREHGYLIEKL